MRRLTDTTAEFLVRGHAMPRALMAQRWVIELGGFRNETEIDFHQRLLRAFAVVRPVKELLDGDIHHPAAIPFFNEAADILTEGL